MIGLGILLLASLASRYLELFTIDWLVQSFWAQIVIAMIVLFQPEIRRALAHIGEAQFLNFASAEELKSLEEIVRAAVSLANRKIGALIVIERDTSLKDFVEIGTNLDARVSKELLLSIFHPTSPIHDGAVIIKGNRVAAAGCFLPITLSSELSKSLGTRHRAGIGLTEETDAVAIIVSEETGFISVATRRQDRGEDGYGDAERYADRYLYREKEQEMKKLLTENLGLKISAVLISVFLWFFVTSRGQSEISL